MQQKPINFEAIDDSSLFSDKPPILNRIPRWVPKPLRTALSLLGLVLFIVVFFSTPVVVMALIAVGFWFNVWVGALLVAATTVAVGFMYRRQQRIYKARRSAPRMFAQQNGWQYGAVGSLVKNFRSGEYIASSAQNNVTLYSIQGEIDDHDFELLIGWKAAKNSTLEPLCPQLFIASRKKLPSAVLVSRTVTDGSSLFDGMLVPFKDATPISLEGDFDKSFQLYIPKGSQVDALALIAPDFMYTLKDFSAKLTVELSSASFALTPAYSENISKQMVIDMFLAARKIIAETDY